MLYVIGGTSECKWLKCGGEFLKLRNYLNEHGISHFTTPPHTPELNAYAERRRRHIVETGRALLHYARLPPSFWSYAF